MPRKKDFDADVKEARELIGKGIISGLLKPGRFGIEIVGFYNQAHGGYSQQPGCTHWQGSGDYSDYHQGTAAP